MCKDSISKNLLTQLNKALVAFVPRRRCVQLCALHQHHGGLIFSIFSVQDQKTG